MQDDAYLLRTLTRDLLLTGRQWRKMARGTAARHGVSEAAASPLVWIARLGENVRQTALAEAVGIEGASLVRLLDDLVAAGLVLREPDPADRRANNVTLTDAGRRVVGEIETELDDLRRAVFSGHPRADIEAALRVLAAITTAAAPHDTP
jgi:MarR family transcriptional regulator for hemolysin